MRPSLYLLLALLASSCATFPDIKTCPDAPKPLSTDKVVISDIDDTIKDTHVRLPGTHAYNPLVLLDPLLPWHAVAGMPAFYKKQKWDNCHLTTVIYVSAASCWGCRRLKLEAFIDKAHFPCGEILLRDGGSPIAPHDYKTKAIGPIIARSCGHHFILVGDSGEFDPECYGELARQFPGRVEGIYIRIVSRETDYRFRWAFRDIDPKKVHFIPDLPHWHDAAASPFDKAAGCQDR